MVALQRAALVASVLAVARLAAGAGVLDRSTELMRGNEARSIEESGGKLSVTFEPGLSFTMPGQFANESPSLRVDRGPKAGTSWLGQTSRACPASAGCIWQIHAHHPSRFVVYDFLSPDAGFNCVSDTVPELMVWFRSLDGGIVFAAPAIPDKATAAANKGALAVTIQVADAGVYDVTLAAAGRVVKEAGAHGTESNILPVRGGPWRLWVRSPSDTWASKDPPAQKISLPSDVCVGADNPGGRWVRCSSAGIEPERCLRDGWVFVPLNCRFEVNSPVEMLDRAASLRPHPGRPLWLAVLGSSIERGTIHTLLDLVGGVRADHVSDVLVRDGVFAKETTAGRGEGSLMKCWGWSDVQIGSLRLSYSDFRTSYWYDDTYWPQSLQRLKELLHEGGGPDVVIVNVDTINGKTVEHLVRSTLEAIKGAPHWRGTLVLAPVKERFLSGGIRRTYCEVDDSNLPRSMAAAVREHIRTALVECGAECSRIVDDAMISRNKHAKLVVGDEVLMAWAFVFDAEFHMGGSAASQHFHYEALSVLNRPVPSDPKGICSSHDGRQIFGAVPEMAAQMYMGMALRHAAGGAAGDHGQNRAQPPPSTLSRLCTALGGGIVQRAPVVRSSFCADCPAKSCCPFKPPRSNPMSLSVFDPHYNCSSAVALQMVPDLNSMEMRSCFAPRDQVDCQAPCAGKSGACDFCGPFESCCRAGDPASALEEGCGKGKLGCTGMHCCVVSSPPTLPLRPRKLAAPPS